MPICRCSPTSSPVKRDVPQLLQSLDCTLDLLAAAARQDQDCVRRCNDNEVRYSDGDHQRAV